MIKKVDLSFRFFVLGKLEMFEEYAQYIESNLEKELDSFREYMDGLSDDDKEEFIDCHYDEIAQYRDDFPTILRNSLFISVYSFLEDKIIDLCDQPDKTSIKLDDLQGNGIKRASLFIKKVKKEDFPDNTDEWRFINNANQVRNCIVHCGGDVEKANNTNKVKNAVAQLENVSIDKHNKLILNDKFCFEFINISKKFLKDLYKKN